MRYFLRSSPPIVEIIESISRLSRTGFYACFKDKREILKVLAQTAYQDALGSSLRYWDFNCVTNPLVWHRKLGT